MALRDFRDDYRQSVQDVTNILGKVDLVNPENNIIPKEASTYELLKIQAEAQSQTLSEALSFIKGIVPLAETNDQHQLIAGGKVNVQAQQEYLTGIAEKNNLLTRMLQQRHQEKNSKTCGSYFDPLRDPICMIPAEITNGNQTQVSDSALKLLPTFLGDTDKEHENLRSFLRAVYDVAITNRLTEACTKAVLRRKLAGTARKLIDSYELEMEELDHPTLKEIVLKLEDRFMADLQPELANARLSMLKKTPHQTYQALEGEIAELSVLAARGEKENKSAWIKQRKIEVFKAAISEEDRQLLSRETQSRNITGISEMNLSQAVDFLIKNYSEQHAFMEANQIKKYPSNEVESLQTINETETKSKKKKKKEMAMAKKAIEDQKLRMIFSKFMSPTDQANRPMVLEAEVEAAEMEDLVTGEEETNLIMVILVTEMVINQIGITTTEEMPIMATEEMPIMATVEMATMAAMDGIGIMVMGMAETEIMGGNPEFHGNLSPPPW